MALTRYVFCLRMVRTLDWQLKQVMVSAEVFRGSPEFCGSTGEAPTKPGGDPEPNPAWRGCQNQVLKD